MADNGDNGIVPLALEITSGTYTTLWAPGWTSRGEQWQAFLGDDESVVGFPDAAHLLAYISTTRGHDLTDHPRWGSFVHDAAASVVPGERGTISLIGVPRLLAGRPGYENTRDVAAAFRVLRSLGTVCGIEPVTRFFHSYSVLANVQRGADHYAGPNGLDEWSAVGHAVLSNWRSLLDALEEHIRTPEVPADEVTAAQERIDAAAEKAAERAAAAGTAGTADAGAGAATGTAVAVGAADAAGDDADATPSAASTAAGTQAGEGDVDPYDSTPWAEAGIDPIRITVDGTSVYTLRCYLGRERPVFLGRHGLITTFPSSRALVRWMIDNRDHDLADLATWGDLVTAANAGELEVTVHPTNTYAFTGLRDDIATGVDAVDTDQLGRAYEVLADAADWAGDDGVNKVLLAYPRLQDYIAYMLGSPSEGTPTAPFDEEVAGWRELEQGLIRRFSKF